MQRYIERTVVGLLVIVMVGLAFHTPVMVLLETSLTSFSVVIKAWKEMLLGVVLMLLLVYVWRRGVLRDVLSDKLVILVVMIAVLHVLLVLLIDNQYVSEMSGLVIDLRNYLLFVELYVAVRYIPRMRRLLLMAVAVGVAVIIGFGLLQATVLPRDVLGHIGYSKETIQPYLTVDLNDDYVRINSTLRGPNPVGAFALLVLSLATAWAVKRRALLKQAGIQAAAGVFACSSLIVLWASHSRSAWLGVVAAGMALLAAILPKKAALLSLAGVSICIAVLIGGAFAFRDVPVVSNVLFHNNQVGGSEHKSDDGHLDSLQHGTQAMLEQPIGSGVGSSGSASLLADEPVIIENQFLLIAHESGWLGLVLQVVLLVAVLLGLWRRREDWLCLGVGIAGIGLIVIGILLPVWADDVIGLYWWGLAGLALGSSATLQTYVTRTTRSRHKKTA